MTVSLSIDVDDEHIRTVLQELVTRGARLQPALDAAGAVIENSTRQRFVQQRDPDGVAWQPSIRAIEQGGQTLRHTGELLASIARAATDTEVVVGTNVIYAAIHQTGGTIRPKTGSSLKFKIGGRTVYADKVTIPARPFMGINEADEDSIVDILRRHLEASGW